MKLAVVGSRDWSSKEFVFHILDDIPWHLDEIVSGGAKGVDSFAEEWAKLNNVAARVFQPDWNKHGKSAGFIRNKDIVNAAEKVIAFWDEKSRGTKNSIDIAREQNKLWMVLTLRDYREWCHGFTALQKF